MMDGYPLMKKLQLKGSPLTLIKLPEALAAAFPAEAQRAEALPEGARAVLAFADTQESLASLIHLILPGLAPDAILWLAYPKKTSKRYRSDITRDQGWAPLAAYDYEPVSQVALDEDWSALRFKPFAQIKNPARKGRMIQSGKEG